jgi:peptide/nickel transport system ATP-binding protein
MADPLIVAKGIRKYFLATKHGLLETLFRRKPLYVHAVDDVDLEIGRGEILALVGESGSGKTTVGRILATLEKPNGGELYFDDQRVTPSNVKDVRKQIQMVFQNPMESLDPRMSISQVVEEPLRKLGLNRLERRRRVEAALNAVGLEPSIFNYRRPRDLSGGQRQRVAVARAIVSNPKFIVLDEPTSALDASVQAQVLNLLVDLHRQHGFTYLFITHNISVARYIADRVAVMYAGKIVETGDVKAVMTEPRHPYSQALLKSVPTIERRGLEPPTGEVPSLIAPPSGCRFHPRCPYVMEICRREEPALMSADGVKVSCWLYGGPRNESNT